MTVMRADSLQQILEKSGGVMGRPETMCPRTNFLGPWSQINRPETQCVPGMIQPCHYMRDTINICDKNDRDVSKQVHLVSGTIYFGDQGPQTIRSGTHRYGTSHHPIKNITFCSANEPPPPPPPAATSLFLPNYFRTDLPYSV